MTPARLDDFTDKHTWLSCAPESGFVQIPMAERRDATGVEVIRGLIRSRVGKGGYVAEPLVREDDWFDILADDFGIHFDRDRPQRQRLWAAALAAQRAWEAAQPAEAARETVRRGDRPLWHVTQGQIRLAVAP